MTVNEKKKLCIFTLYTKKGASSNYRILQFENELEKKYITKIFSFWNEKYIEKYIYKKKKFMPHIVLNYVLSFIKRIVQILFIASRADIVFFQKACIPKCSLTFIPFLKKRGTRIVFDVDDAVYLLPRDNSEKIAKYSDMIICGNKKLKNHYEQYNANIAIIPSIDGDKKFENNIKNTFDNKIIGWIGSSATLENLELLIEPLNNLAERHPELRFLIISDTAGEFQNKIKNCIFKKWTLESYIGLLSEITVGVMPLFDNQINQGKCGFKLIQYMNLEKPVVASDIGINSQIIRNSGFISHSTSEWEKNVEKLLFNEDLYLSCVENIRKVYKMEFGYENILNQIINAIGE